MGPTLYISGGRLIIISGTERMDWHQSHGNHVWCIWYHSTNSTPAISTSPSSPIKVLPTSCATVYAHNLFRLWAQWSLKPINVAYMWKVFFPQSTDYIVTWRGSPFFYATSYIFWGELIVKMYCNGKHYYLLMWHEHKQSWCVQLIRKEITSKMKLPVHFCPQNNSSFQQCTRHFMKGKRHLLQNTKKSDDIRRLSGSLHSCSLNSLMRLADKLTEKIYKNVDTWKGAEIRDATTAVCPKLMRGPSWNIVAKLKTDIREADRRRMNAIERTVGNSFRGAHVSFGGRSNSVTTLHCSTASGVFSVLTASL